MPPVSSAAQRRREKASNAAEVRWRGSSRARKRSRSRCQTSLSREFIHGTVVPPRRADEVELTPHPPSQPRAACNGRAGNGHPTPMVSRRSEKEEAEVVVNVACLSTPPPSSCGAQQASSPRSRLLRPTSAKATKHKRVAECHEKPTVYEDYEPSVGDDGDEFEFEAIETVGSISFSAPPKTSSCPLSSSIIGSESPGSPPPSDALVLIHPTPPGAPPPHGGPPAAPPPGAPPPGHPPMHPPPPGPPGYYPPPGHSMPPGGYLGAPAGYWPYPPPQGYPPHPHGYPPPAIPGYGPPPYGLDAPTVPQNFGRDSSTPVAGEIMISWDAFTTDAENGWDTFTNARFEVWGGPTPPLVLLAETFNNHYKHNVASGQPFMFKIRSKNTAGLTSAFTTTLNLVGDGAPFRVRCDWPARLGVWAGAILFGALSVAVYRG